MDARSTPSITENHIAHIVPVCTDSMVPASGPGTCHMRIPVTVEDVEYADLLIHLPSARQFIIDH
jgi:dual specificity phosphatase 12